MTRYCYKYADIHLTRQGLLLTNLSKVSGSPQSYYLQSQEWVTMGSPQNSSKVATANLPISLYNPWVQQPDTRPIKEIPLYLHNFTKTY